MTEKDKKTDAIRHHIDGISVQWQDILRQTDPSLIALKVQQGIRYDGYGKRFN
jgi:hypothetical protein